MVETTENGLNQPPNPPNLGGLLKMEDTPGPPARSILHLFHSGLDIVYQLSIQTRSKVIMSYIDRLVAIPYNIIATDSH